MKPIKQITVFSDMSERIYYNIPELPIYAHCDPLSAFTNYRCPCHWHRDLEFIHVVSGELHFFVNGQTTVLRPGEGLVVNSTRLHYGFSPQLREAWFSCAVIGPSLFENLTTATAQRCRRAFSQQMDDYLKLEPNVDWQRDALMIIERVVRLMPGGGMRGTSTAQRTNSGKSPVKRKAGALPRAERQRSTAAGGESDPLPAVAAAIELCSMVLDRFQQVPDQASHGNVAGEQRDRLCVLEMTGTIQRRFRDPLALKDIAAAGGVSRSQCCMLFNRYVGRTPNEYLTERRIEEARMLLHETSGSVAEIAQACGFSSSSYFINVFRKRIGMTPGEFRASR